MPKRKSIRKKVDKAAAKITKAVGARKLAKYTGETIARRKNKSIKRTVTKKEALRSGAALAANIATLAAGGAGGGALRAASKARKAKTAKSVVKKGIKIAGQKKRAKYTHYKVGKKKGITH